MPLPYTRGLTPQERLRPFPCDRFLQKPYTPLYRGVTVYASAEILFRWLCQMRVAPYSYDWIMMRRQLRTFQSLSEQTQDS